MTREEELQEEVEMLEDKIIQLQKENEYLKQQFYIAKTSTQYITQPFAYSINPFNYSDIKISGDSNL